MSTDDGKMRQWRESLEIAVSSRRSHGAQDAALELLRVLPLAFGEVGGPELSNAVHASISAARRRAGPDHSDHPPSADTALSGASEAEILEAIAVFRDAALFQKSMPGDAPPAGDLGAAAGIWASWLPSWVNTLASAAGFRERESAGGAHASAAFPSEGDEGAPSSAEDGARDDSGSGGRVRAEARAFVDAVVAVIDASLERDAAKERPGDVVFARVADAICEQRSSAAAITEDLISLLLGEGCVGWGH